MFLTITHTWLSGTWTAPVRYPPIITQRYSFIPLPVILIERDVVRGPPVD